MSLPLGFEIDLGKDKVYQLKKSLYRLKCSPRAWFGRFEKVVTSFGFKVKLMIPFFTRVLQITKLRF